jgi:hypothetical protein
MTTFKEALDVVHLVLQACRSQTFAQELTQKPTQVALDLKLSERVTLSAALTLGQEHSLERLVWL